MDRVRLSVEQLNYLVSECLQVPELAKLEVEGECSQPKHYPSGHFYFTLKDDKAAVSCVMFRSDVLRHKTLPTSGEAIICKGRVGIYIRDGRYQLYVTSIESAGEGRLWLQFEALKEELRKQGYFSPERKKPLPFLPRTIGIVTSEAGAVLRDIVHVARRRFPGISFVLIPVRVQGEGAALEIATAIRLFNQLECADVLIVGRGGGSLEDLWAFNEKIVADAIYDSHLPIISAVGHETDFSIADFVADLRAPTPSAAAELAVPRKDNLLRQLRQVQENLARALERIYEGQKRRYFDLVKGLDLAFTSRLRAEGQRLDQLANHQVFHAPGQIIKMQHDKLQHLSYRLRQGTQQILRTKRTSLRSCSDHLRLLNPWHILERGYTAVLNPSGQVVSGATYLQENEQLALLFVDGKADVLVEKIYLDSAKDDDYDD